MNKRPVRTMSQLPYCYHEGYLEKRSFKDKKSRKLWTCLCGTTLFFFNDKRDTEYLEKLDLSGLTEITDDTSVDCNLDAARLNLQIKDVQIGFSAPNAEARELWKGFIQSVSELSVSSSLNLMPGQIVLLEEVVKKEKERQKNVDMPDCFHPVSRTEAELLLEREASRGNLLLRPSSYGSAFAISTREEFNGPIYKHYHVSRNPDDSFTINLDRPVTCASLPDIVHYFMDTTDGALISLPREDTYEQNISFVGFDNENGERTVRDAAVDVTTLNLPTKPAMTKASSQEEENIYVNDSEERILTDKRSPEREIKPQVKSRTVPIPACRKNLPSSQASVTVSTHSKETKMRIHMDPLGQSTSALRQTFTFIFHHWLYFNVFREIIALFDCIYSRGREPMALEPDLALFMTSSGS